MVAAAIPVAEAGPQGSSLLERLEERLHPFVALAILPLFAFANAGVSLEAETLAWLLAPVPLGIIAGLVIGKPLGIVAASWLALAAGVAQKPAAATWPQLLGVGMLGGIGFTMSLFIGTLAWETAEFAAPVRLGVLAGSLVSGLAGYAVLRATAARSVSAAS